ncbi:MAG: single-stranded DNA-binding protein [Burkholderia sp.]|nr:single-stranded DNA-binding protein [Burkholderia sp.]
MGKTITVGNEQRNIVELRVFSDEYKRVGEELVQDDSKCIGIDVTIWNERLGKQVMEHLKKGARVEVKGDLFPNRYEDRETHELRTNLQVNADSVTLALNRVKSVEFAQSRREREESQGAPA